VGIYAGLRTMSHIERHHRISRHSVPDSPAIVPFPRNSIQF
jgi:hypothetical protein